MPYPVSAVRGQNFGGAQAPWWLSGGISATNCVAAYQPKGAASLASSMLDLSGSGHPASLGVSPTWDAVNGWVFDGVTQWLSTGLTPSETWTVLMQFSNGTTAAFKYLFGAFQNFGYACLTTATDMRTLCCGAGFAFASNAPLLTAGNYGLAGKTPYRNGIAEQNVVPAGTGTETFIYIGAQNNGSSAFGKWAGKVQAFGVWNNTLTPAQVNAVSNAMAAL